MIKIRDQLLADRDESERGLWLVRSADNKFIGIYDSTYKDVVMNSIRIPNFITSGRSGTITKVKPIKL